MKAKKNKLVDWDNHLNKKYGKPGTKSRAKFEEGYEAFKVGVIIQQMREEQKLTQEELASKCGTTKSYISRIENDASDIRLSTLLRIVYEGLGAKLSFSLTK